jgi:hypothetical protein
VDISYSLNMSSSGTESDSSASSVVDFDDYGEFGYQLEPEYTEEELRLKKYWLSKIIIIWLN